ncbi:trans-2,3-dihydro-3-hydroxyanthranilate isomerase [Asanoa ferruginea]|uniref:Trans-2,3-dihydro-3-hydroxyanthranilate isomerase n=1 Tax=Asanoa ferruginea TaxID=53367 RepID=A0A3D9ZT29_9ACTN|nr:PhzF family phenazine biosynthesis protein [Asanoa ferruginea]REF96830.1 trans-2,3-dihydro-3-hydroxyanthranilate isomerase [Asanoa ferruginea]
MTSVAYEIVDVFTDRPFTGNPLAVVFGGEELASSQMQALAREFNLSETVFVLPPSPGAEATYRARIFTPNSELPFAGHPSVGAAVTASARGLFAAGSVVQECGAGLLPVVVSGSTATLTGGRATVGEPLEPGPLLAAVGLTATDLDGAGPPRVAGCGLEFPYLPVRPDAVARARLDRAISTDVDVFAWDPQTRTAHARVFVPGLAVPEDPATGSAALGLGVWLVTNGLLPADGESSYVVHQGVELHRPSVLECSVTAVGGVVTNARVTGNVVPIARGEMAVPPFIG